MKVLPLFLIGASCASAQLFSAGLKIGVPFTDFINATPPYSTVTNRYIIGATAELHLPFQLGVELDALYRHVNYAETGVATTASAFEFPLLLKYRFPMKLVRPYVDAGAAWDTLAGLTQSLQLKNNTVDGFVMGAGLDAHLLVIHVMPEIRYTRWGSQHFSVPAFLDSNQNQAEFLVGITF
jgi:Outer membrane protein beta-barrel domain